MAAATGDEAPVRLRLLFDYPPPGTPACGLCWLLLEPRQVRLVTDLSSLVRDKFGFSRRAKLSLFLDGALLPPTESARIVRDNDSLRVKLEEVIGEDDNDKIANGFGNHSKKRRKRHRQKLEVKDSDSEDEGHRKRKKGKWNCERLPFQEESAANIQDPKALKKRKNATGRSSTADSGSDDSICHSKKLKKKVDQEKEQGAVRDKKKRRKEKAIEINNTSQKTNKTFSLSPSQKSAAKTPVAQSGKKKCETSSDSSTSSSESDHNIADAKRKHSNQTKVASQPVNKPQLASSVKSAGKVAAKQRGSNPPKAACSKKAKSPSSSSDSDSTSGEQEEQKSNNLKSKQPCNSQGTAGGSASRSKPKSSSSESDSSDSEACTAKKPKTNPAVVQTLGGNGIKQLPAVTCGPEISPSESRRGRGRGENPFWRGPRVRGCRGMIRGRGRGRGESPNFFHNYNGEQQKQQQLHEVATNTSVIIQNPPEAPKKDYSILPLLAAPPQVGEKIAFKLLELTENYTPEVSDYKEGKIVSWNPANKQLELEILSFSSVSKEPGKFDLVYQSADGAERIEYAVSHDRKITESWDALIEPRLIVDPPNNESGTGNGNP